MTAVSDIRTKTKNRFPGISGLRPLALGGLGGAAGFALNMWAVPVSFGLDFLFGGLIWLFLLRLFGAWPALLAAFLSPVATIFIWGHPYAALIWIAQAAFMVLALSRWNWSLPKSCIVFWVLLGLPAIAGTYGFVLGMPAVAWGLVAVKQAINAFVLVLIVEAAIFLYAAWAQLKTATPSGLNQKLSDLVSIVVMSVSVLAVLALLIRSEHRHFEEVLQSASKNATTAVTVVLEEKRHDMDRAAMLIAKRWALKDDFGDIMDLYRLAKVRVIGSGPLPAESIVVRSVAENGLIELGRITLGQIGSSVDVDLFMTVDDYRGYVDRSIDDVSIRTLSADDFEKITAGRAMIATFGGGKQWLIRDRSPGMSVMQSWSNASIVSGFKMHSETVIFGQKKLSSDISLFHKNLLADLIVIAAGLVGIYVISVLLSRSTVRDLEALVANIKSFDPGREARVWQRGDLSHILEVAEVQTSFATLVEQVLKSQSEARRQEERLRHIINDAPAALFVLDTAPADQKDRRKFFSDSVYSMTGFTPEETVKSDWFGAHCHPDDIPSTKAARERLFYSGRTSLVFRFRHKDGHYLSIYSELQLATDPVTGEQEIRGIWIDQTKQREAEEQLVQSSKMADLGIMATGMAHELNQPLNIIDLAAANLDGALRSGRADAAYVASKLERIRAQVSRASKIIDHMRIFGRTDSGGPGLCHVAQVLDSLSLLFRKQLSLDGISFEISGGPSDLQVNCNPGLLEQILLNLISNARDQIKSRRGETPSGGHRISVRFSEIRMSQSALITVSDTGGGIDAGILPRIFEPFVTGKEPGKGTGLGLSVAYGIIKDAGGSIDAVNRHGGAEFAIRLPLPKSEDPRSEDTRVDYV